MTEICWTDDVLISEYSKIPQILGICSVFLLKIFQNRYQINYTIESF